MKASELKLLKKTNRPADRVVVQASFAAELRAIGERGIEMPAMEHVIYASVATGEFGAPQLAELLEKARSAN